RNITVHEYEEQIREKVYPILPHFIHKPDYHVLQQILNKYPYTFYAYGSRVKGTARKYSDLDLCYQEDIPSDIFYQIIKEIEESDLPFVVELVDWRDMNSDFQELIKSDLLQFT
ncbi:9524_t:CDS:2, partial [Racocetra persica]